MHLKHAKRFLSAASIASALLFIEKSSFASDTFLIEQINQSGNLLKSRNSYGAILWSENESILRGTGFQNQGETLAKNTDVTIETGTGLIGLEDKPGICTSPFAARLSNDTEAPQLYNALLGSENFPVTFAGAGSGNVILSQYVITQSADSTIDFIAPVVATELSHNSPVFADRISVLTADAEMETVSSSAVPVESNVALFSDYPIAAQADFSGAIADAGYSNSVSADLASASVDSGNWIVTGGLVVADATVTAGDEPQYTEPVMGTLLLRSGGMGLLGAGADAIWTGGSGYVWGTPGNWSTGAIPDGVGASAIISENDLLLEGKTISDTVSRTLGKLTFTGTSLSLTNYKIGVGTNTFTFDNGGSDAFIILDGNKSVTILNKITLNDNLVVNVVSTSTLTLSGSGLNGSAAQFVKNGAGKMIFSGTGRTFAGDLIANGGIMETTLASANNASAVIGAVDSTKNYFNSGNITVGNIGTLLEIKSSGGNYKPQAVEINGAVLKAEFGAVVKFTESAAANGLTLKLNSGTLDGGTNVNRGTFYLSGTDLLFNEKGLGGTTVINTPNLVFDTSANATVMTVKLNNGMLSGFGLVRKTGSATALDFTDSGTLGADTFQIDSGAVNFGTATLNLTGGGLKFADTTAVSNLSTVSSNGAAFGKTNQLSAGGNKLSVADSATGVLKLGGFSQVFGDVTLGANAKLFVYMQPASSAPMNVSFGDINAGASGTFSILGWRGNPNTHIADGNAAVTDNVSVSSISYNNVWFRGFDKGAVLGNDGILRPTDFLHTAWTGAAGAYSGTNYRWLDIANWSVDTPNYAGAVASFNTLPANVTANLESQTVTIGHLVLNGGAAGSRLIIGSGTLSFDSGVTGTASTITGTGLASTTISAVQLKNDLTVSTATALIFTALSGNGDITINSGGITLNNSANPEYNGNVTLNGGRLTLGTGSGTVEVLGANTNVLRINGGEVYGGTNLVSTRRIGNKVEFAGDFTASFVGFDYAGDVSWTGTRTITGENYVGFGEQLRLTGSGELVVKGGAGNGNFYFENNNNDFTGGLTVRPRQSYGTGGAYVTLRGDMTLGADIESQNYLGAGSVTAYAGINITTGGYATTVSGSLSMGTAASATAGAQITFTGGGSLTFDSNATITRLDNSNAAIVTDGNLAVNGATLVGKPNFIFNPDAGATNTVTSTGSILGVGSVTKNNAGTTILDAPIAASSFLLSSGLLVLNKGGVILDTAGAYPGITLLSGTLQATAGTAATPNVNRFGTLSLTGNASVFLEDHSAITFSGVSWGAGKGYSLNLQNSTGIWSTSLQPELSDTYVRFLSAAALSAAQLNEVAFTGYEKGSTLVKQTVAGVDYWFLAPTGSALMEWRGAADTGVDTNRLWSTGSNWVGDVSPNRAGVVAAVRDLDGLLGSNILKVDTAVRIGKLLIESNGSQQFSIVSQNGGTITFDNLGIAPRINVTGNNVAEIAVGIQLLAGKPLEVVHTGTNAFTLSGKISGSGGIVSDYAGPASISQPNAGVIRFAGNVGSSDYTGGFWLKGATGTDTAVTRGARLIVIATDGTIFGTGTNTGSPATDTQALHIGEGTGSWYHFVAEGGARTVNGTVRFDGNLYHNSPSGLTFTSTASSYVTSGLKQIHSGAGSILHLDTPIAGPGGFLFGGSNQTVNFYKTNTFGGGIYFLNAYSPNIGIGANNALGAGSITYDSINSGNAPYITALNGDYSLSNEFIFNSPSPGKITARFQGNITLDRAGTSQLLVTPGITVVSGTLTFGNQHVLTGPAGLIKNGGGVLRVLSASQYTGDTELYAGIYQSGNDLSFGAAGSIVFTGGTLASYDGTRTLANKVLFNAVTVGLDGTAGLLVLNPSMANGDTSLDYSPTFAVSGNVEFGQNLKLTGSGSFIKTGAGTLMLDNGYSTYMGGTTVNHGTLRVNAVNGFTSGRTDAGKNGLGTGSINLSTVSGQTAVIEVLVGGSNTVRIGGDLSISGANASSSAEFRVTNTAGSVSGSGIKTYLEANQTIGGNAYGAFVTPGDVIKTGAGTTTVISVGKFATPSLVVESGTIRFSAANSVGNVGKLTIKNGTFATGGLNQTFGAGSSFNISGDGIVDMGNSGILTFDTLGNWATGSMLSINNWAGTLLVGGGTNQFRFSNDVRLLFTSEMLSRIIFDNATITYAPGAIIVRNAAGYYELLPVGTSAEWNHLGSGYNWGTGSNWVGGIQPNGAGSSAVFANADPILNGKTVNVDASITIGSLVFKNTAGASYTLSGNSLTLQQTDADANAMIVVNGNNHVNLASQLNLANNLFVSHDGTGTLTVSGVINGSTKTVTKDGTGTLVFNNGGNNFAGGLKIIEGTVATGLNSNGATGALGAGTVTFAGDSMLSLTANGTQTIGNAVVIDDNVTATINTVSGNSATVSGHVTGNGALTKSGAGTLVLTSANDYSGGTHVSAGTVEVRNNAAMGSDTVSFSDNTTLRAGTNGLQLVNAIDLNGVVSIDTQSNTLELSHLSGTGTLNKVGSGTLVLNNANHYTGGSTFTAGTVEIGNSAALGTQGVVLENNTTLRAGVSGLSYANTTTVNGTVNIEVGSGKNMILAATLNGSGTLNKIGSGVLILDGVNGSNALNVTDGSIRIAGASGETGLMTINNGTNVYGDGVYGGGIDVKNGGALYVSPSSNGSTVGTLSVGNKVTLESGSSIVFKLSSEANHSILDLGGSILTASGASLLIDTTGYTGAWADEYIIFANAIGGTDCFFDSLELDNQSKLIDLGDRQYYLGTSGNGIGLMAFIAVPEPSAYGFILLTAISSTLFVRRRPKVKN